MQPSQHFGVVLDDIGMDSTLAHLTETVVRPLSEAAFPSMCCDGGKLELDSHHGFVV